MSNQLDGALSRPNSRAGAVISKMEDILIANIDALAQARPMSISIRSRTTGNIQLVQFPSSKRSDARKFTAILQILHLSREALVAGRVITKRDIYYQNPDLFGTQQYVDTLVDDIALTFEVGRNALNIVAADKGLIAGALAVSFHNGTTLSCNPHDVQNISIPYARAIANFELGPVRWLLVIEKEATFRGLATSRFYESAATGPGILITAKGYPDLSTRQFIYKLHMSQPLLPMYGLVDFDPHGVAIMLTYKNGSRSLRHEENTALTQLSWLGPKSSDILGYQVGELSSARGYSPVDATLPLCTRERRETVRLLSKTIEKEDESFEHIDIIRELQMMLLFNTKAEIQAVDDAGDLTRWLDNALIRAM